MRYYETSIKHYSVILMNTIAKIDIKVDPFFQIKFCFYESENETLEQLLLVISLFALLRKGLSDIICKSLLFTI